MPEWFVTLPVFNERDHIETVLAEVKRFAPKIVVVDDGSSDGSHELLAARDDIILLTHPENRGYGAALITAFNYAVEHDYDGLVTIDCDGQHQPQLIPNLAEALFSDAYPPIDIVSGSRYLNTFTDNTEAPEDRKAINQQITTQLNELLGLTLTDTFCGFKAYRTSGLRKLHLTVPGYAMPLQLWIQAACAGLEIKEFPVPRIYLEEKRSFGGALDDAKQRMAHYQQVIRGELTRLKNRCDRLPTLEGTAFDL